MAHQPNNSNENSVLAQLLDLSKTLENGHNPLINRLKLVNPDLFILGNLRL